MISRSRERNFQLFGIYRLRRRHAVILSARARWRPRSIKVLGIGPFSDVYMSGETATETVQQSAVNMQAVMESCSIIAGGLQDVASEWMRFVQARVEQNLDHLDQLRECRSVQDCVALQTQIVRDNVEAFLQSAHRTSERTTQFAGKAIRQMSNTSVAPR